MKEKLTRAEYEAICAEKGYTPMPAGYKTVEESRVNEISSTVWERWDAGAAYSGPGCEERIQIHAARQRAYFEEKQAQVEKPTEKVVEKTADEPPAIHPGTQAAVMKALGFDPAALGGKIVDGELYKPDARPDQRGPCARCGKLGLYIAGAGETLCARHQDDY